MYFNVANLILKDAMFNLKSKANIELSNIPLKYNFRKEISFLLKKKYF